MESTLFTTLTVTEEASLSGGKRHKKPAPHKPTTTTPPAPTPKPAILTQVALNIFVGGGSGTKLTQEAINIAEDVPAGSTVTQTALNIATFK
ncbi:hypothetical protein [Nostoc sphaeroides]|nr:hypothetical protein [Nostoc sphaeroides]